jgi:hypothetical protein
MRYKLHFFKLMFNRRVNIWVDPKKIDTKGFSTESGTIFNAY